MACVVSILEFLLVSVIWIPPDEVFSATITELEYRALSVRPNTISLKE